MNGEKMGYLKKYFIYRYYKFRLRKKKFFIQSGTKVDGAKIVGGGVLVKIQI
ncbi:MAG: hypothetical protein SOR81_04100 [Fusobacterium sp.]|nr:hypothetical protein [Fusobacterium sp.]